MAGAVRVVVTGFQYQRVISRFDAHSTNRPTTGHTFVPIVYIYMSLVWLYPGTYGSRGAGARWRCRRRPFSSQTYPIAFNIDVAPLSRLRHHVYVVSRSRETVKFLDGRGLQNASSLREVWRIRLSINHAATALLTVEVRRSKELIEFTILSIGIQIMNRRAFNYYSLYYSIIGSG